MFWVWGSGVLGLGLWCSGFRVLVFWVWGSGVLGLGFWVFWVWGSGCSGFGALGVLVFWCSGVLGL